jgi:hypothetical protein
MRLRTRDFEEISGSLMNVVYCEGRGGRGVILLKYFPPVPQQNPAHSPVRSSMLHIRHLWYELPRCSPHPRAGEIIHPIFQVLGPGSSIVR